MKGIFHSLWMNGWSDGLSGDFFHFLIWCDLGRRNINCFFFFCFYVAIFLTVSFSLPRPTIPSPTCIFPQHRLPLLCLVITKNPSFSLA